MARGNIRYSRQIPYPCKVHTAYLSYKRDGTQAENPRQACASFYSLKKTHVSRQMNGFAVTASPLTMSPCHASSTTQRCSQRSWNMTDMQTRGQRMKKRTGHILQAYRQALGSGKVSCSCCQRYLFTFHFLLIY
jgi:hypothetical protein